MVEILKNLLMPVITGVITAIIALLIEYNIRGKFANRIPDAGQTTSANDKKEVTQPTIPVNKGIFKPTKTVLRLPLLFGAIVATITFFIGYWSGLSSNQIAKLEIPKMIQELEAVSDPAVLKAKLDEYNKRGILAVGQKDDFENPNGIFVFVFDEKRVYKTFLFRNQRFFDLRNDNQSVDLPKQFRNKPQAWVIETHKLVRPN